MPAAQGPGVNAKRNLDKVGVEQYQEAAPSAVEPKQRHYLVASPKILTLVSELQKNLKKIGEEIAANHYFAKLLTEPSGPDSNDCKQACMSLYMQPDTDKVPGDPFRHLGIVSRAQNLSKIAHETYMSSGRIAEYGFASRRLADDNQRIDGATRFELLLVAAVLHELGKFQPQLEKVASGAGVKLHQRGYEDRGAKLIAAAGEERPTGSVATLAKILKNHGVTKPQLDYIARCVRGHNKLVELVDAVKAESKKRDYIRGDAFKASVDLMIKSEMALEQGVLFDLVNRSNLSPDISDRFQRYQKRNFKAALNQVRSWLERSEENPAAMVIYLDYTVSKAVADRYMKILAERSN